MDALFANVIMFLIGFMVVGALVWKIYRGLQDDKQIDKTVRSDPHRAAVIDWLIGRDFKNSK